MKDTLQTVRERCEYRFKDTGNRCQGEAGHPSDQHYWHLSDEPKVQAEPAPQDAESLARRFHETYERLAPQFGYETRKESAVPWEQVPERNRNLMIAVCTELAEPAGKLTKQECWEAWSRNTVYYATNWQKVADALNARPAGAPDEK